MLQCFRPCIPERERIAKQVKLGFPILLGLEVTKPRFYFSGPDFTSPSKSWKILQQKRNIVWINGNDLTLTIFVTLKVEPEDRNFSFMKVKAFPAVSPDRLWPFTVLWLDGNKPFVNFPTSFAHRACSKPTHYLLMFLCVPLWGPSVQVCAYLPSPTWNAKGINVKDFFFLIRTFKNEIQLMIRLNAGVSVEMEFIFVKYWCRELILFVWQSNILGHKVLKTC